MEKEIDFLSRKKISHMNEEELRDVEKMIKLRRKKLREEKLERKKNEFIEEWFSIAKSPDELLRVYDSMDKWYYECAKYECNVDDCPFGEEEHLGAIYWILPGLEFKCCENCWMNGCHDEETVEGFVGEKIEYWRELYLHKN